jgi:secreted PhoX family phosphatase
MANHDDDSISNESKNPTMQEVIETRLSRRGFLGSGIAAGAATALGGAALGGVEAVLRSVPAKAQELGEPVLGFEGIPVSSADTVVVPPGYTARVLIAWGDPVSDGPAFQQDASNTADEQAQQWGMHNDGMVYFRLNGSARGLIVQNNEYTDDVLLFPDGTASWNAEKTAK